MTLGGSRHFCLPSDVIQGQIAGVALKRESMAEVLPTHTPALFEAAVKRAAELLRDGEVVALPTETVYGLAANALDAAAVGKIYEIKGRPAHNPIIVHVADVAMARRCVTNWPETAEKLAASFWPGPLTLVLRKSAEIPGIVTAGGETVGVRWPSHPFIQAVIRECGFPLAAPSANPSNQVSPTNAAHVRESLGDTLRLIIDGGQSQVGIESTVLDLTIRPPQVLRPGMIHTESLQAALHGLEMSGARLETRNSKLETQDAGGPLRSPGQLSRHYSPRAELVVLQWRDDAELLAQLPSLNTPLSTTHVIAHSHIPSVAGLGGVSVIPHDAEAYARAIYAELHRCDAEGASCIVVEGLPAGLEWQAIADRLHRAAGL
jgi:L-threonylcarbamoyladenylate synthase